MSTHVKRPVNRICILIPTFKRNKGLYRIVNQSRDLIEKYGGSNTYEVCITDSDATNPMSPHMPVQYFLNPGEGFDDNLYFFWKNNLDTFDYIFTISDDDIFTTWLNPLHLIDAAIETGAEVFMFNHRSYTPMNDGIIQLGPALYENVDLLFNQALLLHSVLDALPRHIGTLYSTRLLRETLEKISLFRGTLHLYAAPVIFAALKGTLKFSDYNLCLYDGGTKLDGAWTVSEDVLNGLAQFLIVLKQLLPHDIYTIAETGFFYNYLGADCWLRKLIGPSPLLKSEQDIRDLLARAHVTPAIPDALPTPPVEPDVQTTQKIGGDAERGPQRDTEMDQQVLEPSAFTIVIPTRDDPLKCRQMLETLCQQSRQSTLIFRVVFLVNDTAAALSGHLQEVISNPHFASLRPHLLHAEQNFLTVEENILHTLGNNLDAVDEYFLVIGNTDQVDLSALKNALEYVHEHQLDLLLVGMMNREVHEGKAARQLYLTPRHMYDKNRLSFEKCHGTDIFARAMTDYGPEGILSFIGCQIYTKHFFKEFCAVLSNLPEPLYGIPLATLELTMKQPWMVGYWPDVTVTRIDHLLFGANSAEQPPKWWIPLSRTKRGLSRHCVLSIICNSLHLSAEAFSTLVNCQQVCNERAAPHLIFTNFLFSFVEQMRNIFQNCPDSLEWRYTPGELQNIVDFGVRLETVEIGLLAEQRDLICKWLQAFHVIGDYSDPIKVRNLMCGAAPVLMLLDARPGMDRWVAQLNS